MTGAPEDRFGDVALKRRFITANQLEAALEGQAADPSRPPLGQILVTMGFLTASQVTAVLKLQRMLRERRAGGSGGDRAEDLVGEVLAGCLILDVLGRGVMGTTYRAHHLRLDRDVAIKVLHPRLAVERQVVERFAREARVVGRLEHPGLAIIHDMGEEGPYTYMVMQLVRGRTLEAILSERGQLPPVEVVRIGIPLAGALHAAHSVGVVHRDVKPANVLVGEDGRVKLVDFGLVRIVDGSEGISSFGELVGTPHYMSPEQAQSAADLDGKSDQYGLGVLLFEAASGQLPITGKTLMELLRNHVQQAAPSLRRLQPDAPPELEALLARMLAKSRDERFLDCRTVEGELRRILRRLTAAEDPPEPSGRLPRQTEAARAGAGPQPSTRSDFDRTREGAPQAAARGQDPPRAAAGPAGPASDEEALLRRCLEGATAQVFAELLQREPRAADELAGRLVNRLRKHDDPDPLLALREALPDWAGRVPGLTRAIGRALNALGQHREALKVLGRDPRPDSVAIVAEQVQALMALGRRDDAVQLLDALGSRRPRDPETVRRLAELRHQVLGDLPRAAAEYGRLSELEPQDAAARQQQGFLLLEAGDAEAAVPALEDAVRRDPRGPITHRLLARAYERTGQRTPAGRTYARALQLDPADLEARLSLLRLLFDAGGFTEAARLAEEGLGHHPDEPRLLLAAASACEQLGRADEARALYRRAQEKAPTSKIAKAGLERLAGESA